MNTTEMLASNFTYSQKNQDVEIQVLPSYCSDHSKPLEGVFVWTYEITITNLRSTPIQLLHRYWSITDSTGHMVEVRGPGVVGEQPQINPNSSYVYSSFANLTSPSGIMYGSYEMLDLEDCKSFAVPIPAFSLDSPTQISCPN